MRFLHIVILAFIIAYPDEVFLERNVKRGSKKEKKENLNGPCGKRYLRQINGKCYYFAMKKMNWFGAQNNCLRKGLNLADLSTSEEFKAITNFLRTRGNMEDYWFGGNDLQSEGRFTYISNGRVVRYLGDSSVVEPTHRSNLDDCLEVRLRENNTLVTDDNCQEKQFFVCEKSDLKCAQPTNDREGEKHHSHEHLHHFHHDAAKGGSNQAGVESDSRPVDNPHTAEVGESPEKDQEETQTESPDTGENTEPTSETEETTEANLATEEPPPITEQPSGAAPGSVEPGAETAPPESTAAEATTAESATSESAAADATATATETETQISDQPTTLEGDVTKVNDEIPTGEPKETAQPDQPAVRAIPEASSPKALISDKNKVLESLKAAENPVDSITPDMPVSAERRTLPYEE
ncbi:activating transcription factor 7-interacting protein 1 [Scaptodrosophila lebanonensis]|uniref:Activating transcription factor 7-interacting protein 1 n=1 Tax=Drosophila lebanonensis TaxID=7225 RepID=A0A6J2TDC0_DROLE|nr:activating transcription factor 7-interacting protein 1 [Scaptodrosophila lebanonensis]